MFALLPIESMKMLHDRAFHLGLGVLLGSPAIVGAHLATSEYRYKTLKALLPLPISRAGLFAAKGILAVAWLWVAMLVTGAATLLASMGLGLGPAVAEAGYRGLLLMTALPRHSLLAAALRADLAFAMAVSLVSRNSVAPLGAAAVAQVAAMLALQGDKGHLLWASLPGLVLSRAAQGAACAPSRSDVALLRLRLHHRRVRVGPVRTEAGVA